MYPVLVCANEWWFSQEIHQYNTVYFSLSGPNSFLKYLEHSSFANKNTHGLLDFVYSHLLKERVNIVFTETLSAASVTLCLISFKSCQFAIHIFSTLNSSVWKLPAQYETAVFHVVTCMPFICGHSWRRKRNKMSVVVTTCSFSLWFSLRTFKMQAQYILWSRCFEVYFPYFNKILFEFVLNTSHIVFFKKKKKESHSVFSCYCVIFLKTVWEEDLVTREVMQWWINWKRGVTYYWFCLQNDWGSFSRQTNMKNKYI